jgi:hypothetical protein
MPRRRTAPGLGGDAAPTPRLPYGRLDDDEGAMAILAREVLRLLDVWRFFHQRVSGARW